MGFTGNEDMQSFEQMAESTEQVEETTTTDAAVTAEQVETEANSPAGETEISE